MQRRNFMLKSTAALALGGLALAGCTTTSNSGAQKTAGDSDERRSIDADVDATMPAPLRDRQGFARAGRASRAACSCSRRCCRLASSSAASTARARCGSAAARSATTARRRHRSACRPARNRRRIIFLFMTQDALDKFRNSDGWSAGGDASVALVKMGANGTIDTDHRHGAGRSVHPDQRRPDGRCVAGRHQGIAPEDLTIWTRGQAESAAGKAKPPRGTTFGSYRAAVLSFCRLRRVQVAARSISLKRARFCARTTA